MYWNTIGIREGLLDLIERDKRIVFEVVCETESLDVLLEAGGDLALVPPEAIALEFVLERGIDVLDLTEFFACLRCGMCGGVVRVGLDHDAVEKEDGAL